MQRIFIYSLLLCLSACGGSGGSDSPPSPAQNQAPTISLASQNGVEGQTILITATVADNDGTIASYEWQQTDGPQATFEAQQTNTLAFVVPAVTQSETVSFSLTVVDNDGATTSREISVTVGTNDAPVILASPQVVTERRTSMISVQASDEQGGVTSYVWEQIAGPDATDLSPQGNALTFMAPAVDEDTQALFRVTVTDAFGKSSEQVIEVTFEAFAYRFSVLGSAPSAHFANSEVTITYATTQQTVQTDAQGQFQIPILTTEEDADALVRVQVTSQQNPWFMYSRIAGSVAMLATQHDQQGDTPLTLTALSTAIQAMIDKLGNYAYADEAFDAAVQKLHNGDLENTELVLKLLADQSDSGATLASTQSHPNMLVFAADAEAVGYYLRSATYATPERVDDAQAATFAQSAQGSTVTLDTSWFLSDVTKTSGQQGMHIQPKDDNTASFTFDGGKFALSIEQASQYLRLHNDGFQSLPLINESTCDDADFCRNYLKEVFVSPLTLGNNQTLAAVRIVKQVEATLFDGQTEQRDDEITNQVMWLFDTPLDAEDILTLNQEYVVRLPRTSFSEQLTDWTYHNNVEGIYLTLVGNAASGGDAILKYPRTDVSGLSTLQSVVGQWQFNNAQQLVIDTPQSDVGDQLIVTFVGRRDGSIVANIEQTLQDKTTLTSDTLRLRDSSDNAQPALEVPGIYTWHLGEAYGPSEFWFELHEDGTAVTYSVDDRDGNAVLDDFEIREMPGYWRLDADGVLYIRRYRTLLEFCQPAQYEPMAGEECVLYHERQWDLLQTQGDSGPGQQIDLYQQHKFFNWRFAHDPLLADYDSSPLNFATYFPRTLIRLAERPVNL